MAETKRGNHFHKPILGERAQIPALGVRGWIDGARHARTLHQGSEAYSTGTKKIMVGNASSAYDLGDIVGLKEVSVDPTSGTPGQEPVEQFRFHEIWDVEDYDVRVHGMRRLAVIVGGGLEADGRYVEAAVSGPVRVQITVNDESHVFVVPTDGDSVFQTSTDGFPILWQEPGTGTRWADVMLENYGDWLLCKAQVEIPADSFFVMDDTDTDSVGGVSIEHVKADLTLTGYSDTVHPPSLLRVSPGYIVAVDGYFLAREVWPRWVRTSDAATGGGCVGHDESGGGAADPWLPGFRALAVDGTTRALVVPDDGYSVGVLATAVTSGKATAKLVEISAGVGTAKSKTFDVHAFESVS